MHRAHRREITKALADERGRRATIRGMHQAVTVPTAGVVRIAYRGLGNNVSPSLVRVLHELRERVNVTDRTRTKRPDWRELSETELDDLIAQLTRSAGNLEAVQLRIRRRGCSSVEVRNLVERLDSGT